VIWKGNPCVIFKQDIYTSFHFCLLSLRETSHQLPLLVLDRKRTRLTEQISVSCEFGKETTLSFSYKLLTYNISFLFPFIKRYVTSASLACAGQKEDSVDTLFEVPDSQGNLHHTFIEVCDKVSVKPNQTNHQVAHANISTKSKATSHYHA